MHTRHPEPLQFIDVASLLMRMRYRPVFVLFP